MKVQHQLLLLALTLPACGAAPPLREGDLIFQISKSTQSLAIQRATRSPYSHMGIVLLHGGRLCVFEAVSKVRFTPFDDWVENGSGRHFLVKRLRDADRLLRAMHCGS